MIARKTVIAAAALLALVVVVLLVLLSASPRELQLTAADEGRSIELQQGQQLRITLEANPTTGYTWDIVEPTDERILRQVGEIEFEPESDLIGAGGTQIIRFEAVSVGQTTLKLVYHRPWESVEPRETFTLSVTVR
jgi:inhibitor of cysteine peptidase